MPMHDLTVHIWSDIACPWCWIGKRSLEQAMASYEGDVTLHWRAFELNPDAPHDAPESVNYAERLAEKYGTSVDEGQAFIDRMVAAGRSRGLEIRFDRIRPSNTFDAHRLLAWAGDNDCQTEMKERLFNAYLHEGRSMSDRATLIELAAEIGLDRERTADILDGDAYARQVREDEQLARRMGISGVPCFVFEEAGFTISGAQPPEVLLDAMRQAT